MVESESNDLHSFNGGQKRLAFYIQRRKNHVIKGRGLPLRLRLSVSDDAPCQKVKQDGTVIRNKSLPLPISDLGS